MEYKLRFNGTAPAWPLLLGQPGKFYDPSGNDSLGSVSYSIIVSSAGGERYELLIDAGHNTVPFLLRNGNHIPNAIILTHAHADHVLGVDWIIQSFHVKYPDRKYPVYCSEGVRKKFIELYPYLDAHISFVHFSYGKSINIEEIPGLLVTPYPVFHGKTTAGATMLYLEHMSSEMKPVIITGDLLCPLLRNKDWKKIAQAGVLCIEMNNRFSCPASTHISFTGKNPETGDTDKRLKDWFAQTNVTELMLPHAGMRPGEMDEYLDEFSTDIANAGELPHTVIDFLKKVPVPDVYLVHYYGMYDKANYNEEILDRPQLKEWANAVVKNEGLGEVTVHIPQPGHEIELLKNSKIV